MSWGLWLLAVLIIFVCGLLMLVILIQRGRGSGLTGAFGGAGGGGGAFGAKTGDVLTWVTVIVAGVFIGLAVVSNFAFDKSPMAMSTPAVTATPTEVPSETDGSTGPIQVTPVDAIPFVAPDLPAGDTSSTAPDDADSFTPADSADPPAGEPPPSTSGPGDDKDGSGPGL